MWEKCTELVTEKGTKVVFDAKVDQDRARRRACGGGRPPRATASPTATSAPTSSRRCPSAGCSRRWTRRCRPRCVKAAESLRYRDFMTVALVVPEEYGFPDTWIYIHDPDVEVGRIQNFASWSPYLVKDGRTCLGLEFFVQEGDEMWTKSDADLVEQGKRELQHLGLVDPVEGRGRLRRADAEGVPVLRLGVQGERRDAARAGSRSTRPTCIPVGRNGMHRYNNQDHSMYTAMLTVENIFGADHDVWSVNVEEEYHEEVAEPSS